VLGLLVQVTLWFTGLAGVLLATGDDALLARSLGGLLVAVMLLREHTRRKASRCSAASRAERSTVRSPAMAEG